MIAIVDYGSGNLRSVAKALENFGHPCRITSQAAEIDAADAVILPGVGAFGEAARNLEKSGLSASVRNAATDGRPFLGICLGYHLLFESSEEAPGVPGLGIFPGHVVRFTGEIKVPHMGWNTVSLCQHPPILADIVDGDYFYFVHSFYPAPADQSLVATRTEYGGSFASSIARGNLFACQFHPEKSQHKGLSLIKNFGDSACS